MLGVGSGRRVVEPREYIACMKCLPVATTRPTCDTQLSFTSVLRPSHAMAWDMCLAGFSWMILYIGWLGARR